MSRTYRALAIMALAFTVVSLVATITYSPVRDGWFAYVPITPSPGGIFPPLSVLCNTVWITTTTIAAPIVSTFGAVVAAQGHHWVWLAVFVALGLLGFYGGSVINLLEIYVGLAQPPRTPGLIVYIPLLTQALPAVAALLFVALARRGQPQNDAAPTSAPAVI